MNSIGQGLGKFLQLDSINAVVLGGRLAPPGLLIPTLKQSAAAKSGHPSAPVMARKDRQNIYSATL